MADKMRATTHSGRIHKSGKNKGKVFSSKHPDRNFDVSKADHIAPESTQFNKYWMRKNNENFKSFDEQEQAFYKQFQHVVDVMNENSLRARHKNRLKTTEDYRKSAKSCPEEVLFEIGNHNKSTSSETLAQVYEDYIKWQIKEYPQVIFLNAALNADEPDSAPHIHQRQVWIAIDENGQPFVNQGEALKQMGVKLPDPTKPEGQKNNRKMTFSKICREKFIEIAKSYGIEIEVKPKDKEQVGKSLAKLKKETLEKREADVAKREASVSKREASVSERETALDKRETEIDEKHFDLNIRIRNYNEKTKALQKRTEAVEDQEKQNERFLQQLQRMAAEINKQIKIKDRMISLEDLPQNSQNDDYDFTK